MKPLIHALYIALILSCSLTVWQTASAAEGIIQVEKKRDICVVYDVNQNDMEAGIGKGLYYVRGLIQSYQGQKIPLKQIHLSVVVHGNAGYWLLKDEKYQEVVNDPFAVNPNAKIVQELQSYGVQIELCHVTMKGHGWTQDDILPGVKVVFDAYTRMIDLQQRGYAYIKL